MHKLKNIKCLNKIIKKKKIIIIMHINPDGDALGSSLALYFFLKKKNKIKIILPNKYPESLKWMVIKEDFLIYKENNKKILKIFKESNIIFCIDFSNLSRIGKIKKIIEKSTLIKIIIDHHWNLENFSDLNFYDKNSSSCSEIIYKILNKIKKKISKKISEYLYTGIITDTGSFKNPNTNYETFKIASNLIKNGTDIQKINDLIYKNNSIEKIEFLSFAIKKRLVILKKWKISYFYIKKNDTKKFNLSTEDTKELLNYIMSLKENIVSALIIERKNKTKISLRSNGNFNVNKIAKKYFNGGGHKNASGGYSNSKLMETIKEFEKNIKKNISETNLYI